MGVYKYPIEQSNVDAHKRAKLNFLVDCIMQTAGVDAEASGFGVGRLNKYNCSWVLSRLAVEVDSLPMCYDCLNIETWISNYERMFSVRNFALSDKSGRQVGRGISLWAMIDLSSRRPQSVEQLHRDLGIDLSRPDAMSRPLKIGTVEAETVAHHTVAYCDIDFNGHLNSVRTIEHLFDMPSYDSVMECGGFRLDVNFSREGHLGDVLTFGMQSGNPYLFEVGNADNQTLIKASLALK